MIEQCTQSFYCETWFYKEIYAQGHLVSLIKKMKGSTVHTAKWMTTSYNSFWKKAACCLLHLSTICESRPEISLITRVPVVLVNTSFVTKCYSTVVTSQEGFITNIIVNKITCLAIDWSAAQRKDVVVSIITSYIFVCLYNMHRNVSRAVAAVFPNICLLAH